MQQGRFVAILSLIASLTLPPVVLAQGSSGVQLFTSYDNSFPGGNGLAGFGLTLGAGPLAVRGSFGLSLSALSARPDPAQPRPATRWNGDADLLIADSFLGLGGAFGSLGLHPYGFGGIGARSVSTSPTYTDAIKTWSYGGGVSFPLGPAVSIMGEMRQRSVLGTAPVSAAEFVEGSEFRFGLDFRFVGGKSSSRAPGSRTSTAGPGSSWPSGGTAAGAARRVVPRGERYLGVPYVWGGETPKGFDCSGFVQYVYRHEGVELPRTSRQMAGAGFAVDRNSMAVGDLLLFADNGPISHVAIYAGNGRIIHSSSSGNGVRYDDLSSHRGRWYAQNIVAIRRVASGSGAIIGSFAKSLIPFDYFDPPDLAPPLRK